MADVKNSTWREQRVIVPQGVAFPVKFLDTEPNYVILVNNAAMPVYMSRIQLINDQIYDIIIPPYGRRIYAQELGFKEIFLFTQAPDGANVYIASFNKEFDPAVIAQTQEVTQNTASGLLGIVDIKNVINPLPAGANKIGRVDIDNMPSLPAGANKIGLVDIDNMPSLPAGTNEIGKVQVTSLPGLPAGIEEIGRVGMAWQIGTLAPSAERTANGSGTAINIVKYKEATLFLNISAVSGTTPTLDVKVESLDPASGVWFEIGTFTQVTAVGQQVLKLSGNLGEQIRASWTIGGTTPSFTFSIGGVFKS